MRWLSALLSQWARNTASKRSASISARVAPPSLARMRSSSCHAHPSIRRASIRSPGNFRSMMTGENSCATSNRNGPRHDSSTFPSRQQACSRGNGSGGQPKQRTRSTTETKSVGNPKAASRRAAATSAYTSGLRAPYLTRITSPSGNWQSNLDDVPLAGSMWNRQSTAEFGAKPPDPPGLVSKRASARGRGGGSLTCARRSASSRAHRGSCCACGAAMKMKNTTNGATA